MTERPMTGPRIAIAGFQHETNTFMPSRASFAEFARADSWPGLLRGAAVVEKTRGLNLPIAGAVAEAKGQGVSLQPVLWCAAEPSGFVLDDAFDRIAEMMLEGFEKAGPLDGIYLDLHGAMVTERHFDGEAELLRRIRARLGAEIPIAVSLDLHANISPELAGLADLITIFRTYPHLDMAETGARAMAQLIARLQGQVPARAFRQLPFLVPLHAQYTGAAPTQRLYQRVEALSGAGEYLDLAMGFPAADVPDCGPAIVAYAQGADRAAELAERLYEEIAAAETAFDTSLLTAREAVETGLALPGRGPVIIADVQDNAGAGASSDTTGLLHALVEAGAQNALLGVLCDAQTCALAHQTGVGGCFDGALGGKADPAGDPPLSARFRVLGLSDGSIAYRGEMYGGGVAEIGPSCLLTLERAPGAVKIVVSSERTQCLDRAFFTHFGCDPSQAALVVVKSTVHFRADFEPGSRAVLNARALGGNRCDLAEIPYRNLRAGLRV